MTERIPDRLRSYFEIESVPLTLSSRDRPDMPVVIANRAFCELTGYPPEEVIGRNCRFLQGEFDNSAERARVRECIEHEQDDYFILANRKKNGDRFLNFLYLAPILVPDCQERFVLGTQFDVTNELHDEVEGHFRKVGDVFGGTVEPGYSNQVVIESKKLAAMSVRNVLQYILETEAGRHAKSLVAG
jgi:PAS domain S-box-containing protein